MQLLKSYGIAPMRSSAMAVERHLVLHHCAVIDPSTGRLSVPSNLVDGLFLMEAAVELVPRSARREIYRVVNFLRLIRASTRRDIASRAASILVEQMLEELVATRVVSTRSTLQSGR